jgi:tetratricopeptide (TPR) repeat protein
MQKISLDTAISEIHEACLKKEEKSPFFFIVGAGISSPIIPLAVEIERECKEIAKKKNRTEEPDKNSPFESYSHWFQQAFPQPKERQEFLKNKIKNKPISLANLRLAHLLSEKNISNLVLTPNFDDMLSRALWLFQIQHIVCDHPATVGRINPDSKDIQILHVHGSYLFYDCCNTNFEINDRTKKRNYNPTRDFLDNILLSRVPLVIGYGGWEEDVIMKALKKRLSNHTPLPYNLYWFCFTENEINQHPPWLKKHNNVKFVIPSNSHQISDSRPRLNLKLILSDERTKTEVVPTLSAVNIFETFLVTFGYNTPPLIKDPLTFFINHIRKSWPKKNPSIKKRSIDADEDLYFIDNVIEKIEKAKKLFKENLQEETQKSQKNIDQIINLVRNSRYLEALKKSNFIDEKSLDIKGKIQLSKALFTASMNLKEHPNETIIGYEKVIQLLNALDKSTKKKPSLIQDYVYSLLFKGFELEDLKKNRSAINSYNEIIKKFENNSNKIVKSCVVDALYHKAGLLIQIDKIDLAIEIYKQIFKKYGNEKDQSIREIIGLTLIHLGDLYADNNEEYRAIEYYDEVIRRFRRTSRNSFFSEMVITALYQKGNAFVRFDRRVEAIVEYTHALKNLEKNNNPEFYDHLLEVALRKAMTLSDIGEDFKAIEIFDDVIKRFSKNTKPEIRSFILDAYLLRGVTLMKMNRKKEAIKAFNEIIKKFSRSKNTSFRENVDIARQKLDCLKNCLYCE